MSASASPAIRVDRVSKRYVIDHEKRPDTLRDALTGGARALFSRLRAQRTEEEEFWALRDVSFEVQPGEVVGIIGRNGAGKSTLLKILSRITEPTQGRIALHGRVASLLEVGTGFHPELSGRENIFLNGAILGMRREEIRRKFDEIVAFAEVERFLDTPVKRYSSGMYVRLAFAVAAHLEPEILIVDEVLAVGDAQFQKKCLGKIESVANGQGRTVLIVSHQMQSIRRLCARVALLSQGRLAAFGPTEEIVPAYLANAAPRVSSIDLSMISPELRRGDGRARFVHLDITTKDGTPVAELRRGEPIIITLQVASHERIENAVIGFSLVAADGTEVFGTCAQDSGPHLELIEKGLQQYTCVLDPMPLCPGRYYIRGAIFRRAEVFDHINEMSALEVLPTPFPGAAVPASHAVGYVYHHFPWTRAVLPSP